jgi:hypothetical protein
MSESSDDKSESSNDESVYLDDRSNYTVDPDPELIAGMLDIDFTLVTIEVFNAFSVDEVDDYLELYAGNVLHELWARIELLYESRRNDWNYVFSLTAEGHACGGRFLQNHIRRNCDSECGLDSDTSPGTTRPHPLAITVFQHNSPADRQFRRLFTTLLNMFADRAGCFVHQGGAHFDWRVQQGRKRRDARRTQAERLTVRHTIRDPTLSAVQVGQVLWGTELQWSVFWPRYFPNWYFEGGFLESSPISFTNVLATDLKTRVSEFMTLCGVEQIATLVVEQACHNDVGAVFPYEHDEFYNDRHFPTRYRSTGADWMHQCLRHCVQRWSYQSMPEILQHQLAQLGGHDHLLRIALEKRLMDQVCLRFQAVFPNYSAGRRYAVSPVLTATKGTQLLLHQYLHDVWKLEEGVAPSIWQHWQWYQSDELAHRRLKRLAEVSLPVIDQSVPLPLVTGLAITGDEHHIIPRLIRLVSCSITETIKLCSNQVYQDLGCTVAQLAVEIEHLLLPMLHDLDKRHRSNSMGDGPGYRFFPMGKGI